MKIKDKFRAKCDGIYIPIALAFRVWDKKDQDFKVNLWYRVNSKSASIKKGDVSKTKTNNNNKRNKDGLN